MGKKDGGKKIEWKSTQTSNLVRRNAATYYAQIKIQGKTYRQSLGTKLLDVARMKLPQKLNDIRADAVNAVTFTRAQTQLLRGCIDVWYDIESSRPDLLAESHKFNLRRKETLLETLPVDDQFQAVTGQVLRAWWKKTAERFNPQYANNILSIARKLLDMQVDAKIRKDNPLALTKPMKIVKVIKDCPSGEEMDQLIQTIQSIESRDMVAMMAYTGMRPSEMLRCQGQDIGEEWILIRATKNHQQRMVPLMDKLAVVAERRRKIKGSVWSIKTPACAMKRASKKINVNITPYTCRHFFTTRGLESGVDIPTMAKWLGHQDGGALLLKTYSHVSDTHGLEIAKKVKFG